MKPWLNSCLVTLCALTISHTTAQTFDLDNDRILSAFDGLELAKRRATAELFGKRDGAPGFDREVRRTRELFGKRQAYPMPSIRYLNLSPLEQEAPTKRRSRELFGKRSADLNSLTSEQMEILANMLMDRQRRARGGELFG